MTRPEDYAKLPIIAVMIGDPAGIGPEVALKAAVDSELDGVCRPLLIGDIDSIRAAAELAAPSTDFVVLREFDDTVFASKKTVVLDPGGLSPLDYETGRPSAAAGSSVVKWVDLADKLAADGLLDGWIMGPVDSTSLKLAKAVESIDELQPKGTFMFRMSGRLRVVPLTEHIPLRDVPSTVTRESVLTLIRLVDRTLRKWGIQKPRIGVAGLNPHAMFEEDAAEVRPAVEDARALNIDVDGPIAPDSVFRHGLEGRYDTIVSMYHDQGQIALKSAAFEGACTVCLGVPYVRATVPHGTAMDIAGRNIAQHQSMLAAFRTAAALATGRGFLS